MSKREVTLPPNTSIGWRGTSNTWSTVAYSRLLAISPDGKRLVMTVKEGARTSLYFKDASDFSPRKVPGTDDATGGFFSPDGQWVGFLAEQAIHKVRLPGGAPQRICGINSTAFDATWLSSGIIVYSSDHGLWSVSAESGDPKQLTTVKIDDGERGHHFPHAIPGTRFVVFTLATDSGQHAALLSLDDKTWTIIKRDATDARYVVGG